MQYVVYQFDPNTGFINATNVSDWPADHPFLSQPNHLALTEYIRATMVTTHPDRPQTEQDVQVNGAGWAFVLKDGAPATDADGNYLLTPPPWYVSPPTVHDYAILGHIRAGVLDPAKDFSPAYITGLNRALASIGARTLDALPVQPTPTRTCISKSAHLTLPR